MKVFQPVSNTMFKFPVGYQTGKKIQTSILLSFVIQVVFKV